MECYEVYKNKYVSTIQETRYIFLKSTTAFLDTQTHILLFLTKNNGMKRDGIGVKQIWVNDKREPIYIP